MHTGTPNEEMNDFERRLAGWSPTVEGSSPDAVLFAAGVQAGRSYWGRRFWPALCCLLVAQSIGLAIWALSERAERQSLTSQLEERVPPRPPVIAAPELPEPAFEPSSHDYLHVLRDMEQDPSLWQTPQATGPLPPEPPVEKPGLQRTRQMDEFLDL